MEWLVAVLLLAFLGYLIMNDELGEVKTIGPRKRLCDYYVPGSVNEDIPTALARGVRLLEVNVMSDEQDHPVVADGVSFESVCVAIENDAFPSEDPFILSIVPQTTKTVTLNECAEHLKTTIRRRLFTTHKDIATLPLDSLKGRVIVVSGGPIQGSELEQLVSLSWNESGLRRLSLQQALHPRDPEDLMKFNKNNITLVGPDSELNAMTGNPDKPRALGCQWNVYDRSSGGFHEKGLAR